MSKPNQIITIFSALNRELKPTTKTFSKDFIEGEQSMARAVLRRLESAVIKDKVGHIRILCISVLEQWKRI